jgi:hypothetical protein
MEISRKRFVETMAGGSALLLFHGCGGGGSSYGGAPAPSPAPASGCSPNIAANHPQPHALLIPVTDLDSTTAKTYDIQGAADHSHTVTFSAAQLAQLKAGTMVTVTSTTTLGHEHQVSVTCVP